MKVLAIDPSINSMGFAFLSELGLHSYGTFEAPVKLKKSPFTERMYYMVSRLDDILSENPVDRIVIEQPQSWGAYKSVASTQSGALLMLHMLAGSLAAWAYGCFHKWNGYPVDINKVQLIPVSKWKGQLPKRITKARMERKYGVRFRTNDESDAVGLGDWFLQEFGGTNDK